MMCTIPLSKSFRQDKKYPGRWSRVFYFIGCILSNQFQKALAPGHPKFKPMIRMVLLLFISFSSFPLIAQLVPSLEEIRLAAGRNEWQKAKEGIERFLAQAPHAGNPEAWQLRSLILYKIVTNKEYEHLAPGGHREAFEAYTRYVDLASSKKSLSPGGHEVLFGLAFHQIEKATSDFQQKRFAEALQTFRQVEEVENYIIKKGLSYQDFQFPAFDTQLYVNIAAAATGAGREDVALDYYGRIADQKIRGRGYDGIYRYLVDRYDKKGEKAIRDRYLQTGRELYPDDPFWCQAALRDAGKDKKKLFERYEELSNSWCNNYVTHYNYAVELYNYSFGQQTRPPDFSKYQLRIPAVLKKALEFQSTTEANLLMSRYQLIHINDHIDEYNSIRDGKPESLRRKEELGKLINQRYEEVKLYAGKVCDELDGTNLKGADRDNFTLACRMMGDYYERKKDMVKAREYREKARRE